MSYLNRAGLSVNGGKPERKPEAATLPVSQPAKRSAADRERGRTLCALVQSADKSPDERDLGVASPTLPRAHPALDTTYQQSFPPAANLQQPAERRADVPHFPPIKRRSHPEGARPARRAGLYRLRDTAAALLA